MNTVYHSRSSITIWIFTCAGMVLAMAVIGAITRLTESGLSMVEWRPLIGMLPPLSEQEWQRVFQLYQQTPEYIQKHHYMDLASFKSIFWWEWVHRFWGRLIGIVFFIPFLYFTITKKIDRSQMRLYGLIFLIGAIQGVIGWYMVKSGLNDQPHVSHYRLALHLTMALFIFMILLWAGFNRGQTRLNMNDVMRTKLFKITLTCLILTIISVVWGAFTAGTKAGYIYNEFPFMGEGIVPEEVLNSKDPVSQFWSHPVAIQFFHRWIALSTFAAITYLWFKRHQLSDHPYIINVIHLVFGFAVLQIVLGISTLLSVVDIVFASLHQANAFLLIGSLLYLCFLIKPARPPK